MNPSKRLHVFQVRVLRALMRQCNVLIATNLGHKNDSTNLFDLRILRRANTVHVASYLDTQVSDTNKAFEHVFG